MSEFYITDIIIFFVETLINTFDLSDLKQSNSCKEKIEKKS